MGYNSIVISSGHGLYVRGASGILDEVDEARLVVEALADELRERGVEVVTYHDDVSKSQNENLNRIVDFHNAQPPHDLDLSCHFNAFEQRSQPVGTEVWYRSQKELAKELSAAIASVGLIDRGAKCDQPDHMLFFLSNTAAPAVLLEICFVDSEADAEIYRENFADIIEAMADVLTDEETESEPVLPDYQPDDEDEDEPLFHAVGTCSHFGGPEDTGVSASEGLAFHYELNEANQHLFLPLQPPGTSGLARRLNGKAVSYLACRWDYDVTPKTMLQGPDMALVRAPATGREMMAYPADWGPHEEKTGRAADLSPWLMQALDITTDDTVEVIYPWHGYDD